MQLTSWRVKIHTCELMKNSKASCLWIANPRNSLPLVLAGSWVEFNRLPKISKNCFKKITSINYIPSKTAIMIMPSCSGIPTIINRRLRSKAKDRWKVQTWWRYTRNSNRKITLIIRIQPARAVRVSFTSLRKGRQSRITQHSQIKIGPSHLFSCSWLRLLRSLSLHLWKSHMGIKTIYLIHSWITLV
jgi:hypothetical protein